MSRFVKSSEHRYLLVQSEFARSCIICPPEMVEELQRWSQPYFKVRFVEDVDENIWVVAAPNAVEQRCDAEVVNIARPGEITCTLAYDDNRRIIHFLAPVDRYWVCQHLLRYTRTIHRLHAMRSGVIYIHSALVEKDGLGVAVVGSSRAGKTSLVMALAKSHGGTLISNDDLGFVLEGNDVRGVGWPRSISIRLDTIDALFGPGQREHYLDGLTHPANATLGKLIVEGVEKHGTALFYPYEYSRKFDVPVSATAKVDLVLFSGFASTVSDRSLVRLSAGEAEGRLEQYTVPLPTRFAEFLNLSHFPIAPSASGQVKTALSQLPCFHYRYVFEEAVEEAERLLPALKASVAKL